MIKLKKRDYVLFTFHTFKDVVKTKEKAVTA